MARSARTTVAGKRAEWSEPPESRPPAHEAAPDSSPPEDTVTMHVTLPGFSLAEVEEAVEPPRLDTPMLPSVPLTSASACAILQFMTGVEAGRVIVLDRTASVVGRDGDVRVQDPAVSRRHARIGRGPDGSFYVQDLGSTNGTFVGPRKVDLSELSSSDHVQLGPGLVLRFAITDVNDEMVQRQLYESAIRDPLTHAYNRRYLADRLHSEIAHARRWGVPLSVLMVDVDHFKTFNDQHGHLAGDRALCLTAAKMMSMVRAEDIVARYGGEEFLVLARSTDHESAVLLAHRLRSAVEKSAISVGGAETRITISVGVASLAEIDPVDDPVTLVSLADQRLYGAKLRGRNQVCAE